MNVTESISYLLFQIEFRQSLEAQLDFLCLHFDAAYASVSIAEEGVKVQPQFSDDSKRIYESCSLDCLMH